MIRQREVNTVPFTRIIENAEKVVGLSAEEIRKYSPCELRSHLEIKNKKKFSFKTEFPVIGRGNVLRDSIITSEEINKDIDKILAHSK
ncbi:MAG: hypothetical protein FWD14_01485 [Treponema sp.]|nr:hypothetical protein [Treponema sp.]